MTAPALFAAESMGKSFGDVQVMKAGSLWARPGHITLLIGRNGAGKSTLIKCALGLVRADYGFVRLDDRATERPRAWALARRGLFYKPDKGLLSPRFTLRQHFDMVRDRFGGDPVSLAESVGIGAVLDQKPYQISGGETRRAETVILYLRRPRVLLADEPLAGVTPSDREMLSEAYLDLARQGAAIVVSGHDAPELFALADDVIWMSAGTTHHIGTPRKALEHEQFVREYLGPGRLEAVRAQLDLQDGPPTDVPG